MRSLNSTPCHPPGSGCDGGGARIYWLRHTCHTNHTKFYLVEIYMWMGSSGARVSGCVDLLKTYGKGWQV